MSIKYHFEGKTYATYAALAAAYHCANGYYPIGRYKPGLGYIPPGVAGVAGARQAPGVYRQEVGMWDVFAAGCSPVQIPYTWS